MGNNIGKIYCPKYIKVIIHWTDGYLDRWPTKLAIVLLIWRFVLVIEVETKQASIENDAQSFKKKIREAGPVSKNLNNVNPLLSLEALGDAKRPIKEKDAQYVWTNSNEKIPVSQAPSYSFEGYLHCITADEKTYKLMEVYCKRFLQNIKVTWYNLTDERIKEFNRGCLILKSKEERFGDTLTSTIETCQFISDDKSLLLVVINTSGGTLYLPDVDISFIKSKTQILCKNGNFGNHATNKAAMYDIKRFLQGSEQDVSPVSISRP